MCFVKSNGFMVVKKIWAEKKVGPSQCDQMSESKVTKFFQKLPKKEPQQYLVKNNTFSQRPRQLPDY